MRKAKVIRETKETVIQLELSIDGKGTCAIESGFGLLDHFLTLIAFWARFDLLLRCKGDLHIDAHHSAEDIGLAFGQALAEACGDRKGIRRVGFAKVPMDEALSEVVVDFSGRAWLEWHNDQLLPPVLGGEEKDIWREFYKSLCQAGKFNLHVSFLYGKNGHHLLESVAKSLGLALKEALKVEDNILPSTKGLIEI